MASGTLTGENKSDFVERAIDQATQFHNQDHAGHERTAGVHAKYRRIPHRPAVPSVEASDQFSGRSPRPGASCSLETTEASARPLARGHIAWTRSFETAIPNALAQSKL
jgi:hypothetical protein